jgi:hypothetical protein
MTARKVANKASMSNQGTHLNSLPGIPSTVGVSAGMNPKYKCGGPMRGCVLPADAASAIAWLKSRNLFNTRKTNGGIGRNANIVHQNCCEQVTVPT